MVDITGKAVTERHAVARCLVTAAPEAIERGLKCEDAHELVRAAGIHGAKRASQLIPLCHPLPVDDIDIRLEVGDGSVRIGASTSVLARTGIEMESLTACAMAGLAMVMHLLPYDPDATMSTLALWHKSGGRSGSWERAPGPSSD